MKNKIFSKLIILLALVLCLAACDGAVHLPGQVKISLDNTSLNVSKGYTKTLTATITPESAAGTTIVWESSNTDIATVDENGVITGKELGKAKITAKAGNATATCDIEVVYVPVKSIVLYNSDGPITSAGMLVTPGNSYQVTAKCFPEDSTDKSITWEWSINKSGRASIDDTTKNPCTVTCVNPDFSATLKANGADGSTISCLVFNNWK